MSLNIKKPRVHELAREAAERAHTSQTSALERALELYLASLRDEAPRGDDDRIDAILADVDLRLASHREQITTDDLYDDAGLPR